MSPRWYATASRNTSASLRNQPDSRRGSRGAVRHGRAGGERRRCGSRGLRPPRRVSSAYKSKRPGVFSTGAPFIGADIDLRDFPFAQMLGLSSYPYFVFAQPEDMPNDYYTRVVAGRTFAGDGGRRRLDQRDCRRDRLDAAEQARYITRHARLLDGVDAARWFAAPVCRPRPRQPAAADSAQPAAVRELGLTDSNFGAKPALAAWDTLHARRGSAKRVAARRDVRMLRDIQSPNRPTANDHTMNAPPSPCLRTRPTARAAGRRRSGSWRAGPQPLSTYRRSSAAAAPVQPLALSGGARNVRTTRRPTTCCRKRCSELSALSAFRGRSASLSTWLVRIVANEALGGLALARAPRCRGSAASERRTWPNTTCLPYEIPVSVRQDPERAAMRTEMRRLLEARIDAPARSISCRLRPARPGGAERRGDRLVPNIPPATVRTRFFRARACARGRSRDIDRAYEDAFEFGGSAAPHHRSRARPHHRRQRQAPPG